MGNGTEVTGESLRRSACATACGRGHLRRPAAQDLDVRGGNSDKTAAILKARTMLSR
jgi:hypothetical protein